MKYKLTYILLISTIFHTCIQASISTRTSSSDKKSNLTIHQKPHKSSPTSRSFSSERSTTTSSPVPQQNSVDFVAYIVRARLNTNKLSPYLLNFKNYIDEPNNHKIASILRKNPDLTYDNLQIAVFSGQCPFVQKILNENKSIAHDLLNCHYNSPESTETLLHFIIDIAQYHKHKIQEYKNDSRLHEMYVNKYDNILKILQILIDYGANINEQDNHGMTPLHKASMYADITIIDILLDAYADVHIINKEQKKAEDYIFYNYEQTQKNNNNNYRSKLIYENVLYKIKNPPTKKRSLYACIMASLFGQSIKIVPAS